MEALTTADTWEDELEPQLAELRNRFAQFENDGDIANLMLAIPYRAHDIQRLAHRRWREITVGRAAG